VYSVLKRSNETEDGMTTSMFGIGLTAGLLAIGSVAAAGESPRSRRPNLVVIFTDDHGWADLAAHGVDPDIRTPHADRLARDGVLFTRGYVTAPQCTPSRAGILTGIYQQRFGVEENGIPLPHDIPTLAQRLKAAGYATGISGKWHLDAEVDPRATGRRKTVRLPDHLPHRHGFDEYFTGVMQDYTASHSLDGAPFPDAPRQVREEGCRVAIQTEAALGFLRRREARPDQPWFLYLSYMAPHTPFGFPEPWFSRTPAHLPKERRSALALIASIDDGVRRIREWLEANGQAENTLIFFISDNGAPLGRAWDGSINLPLRGQKGMLAEGGIRVPFVFAWPGRVPGGQVFDHPVISLDVVPTALAAAGLPRDAVLDGVDLVPHLTGAKTGPPHETLFWRWRSQSAVQEYPYKFIRLGDRERLLFDITAPEGESIERNLAGRKPEIAARLEGKLAAWVGGLKPPGFSGTSGGFDRHHEGMFAEHGMIAAPAEDAASARPGAEPEGGIRGWSSPNGVLTLSGGALAIAAKPDLPPKARPFITNARLDLPGPATVTLRLRAAKGGPASVTWRTKAESFAPRQAASFTWPSGSDWQTVAVELPEEARIIHIRILPPPGAEGLEVESIELRGAAGKPQIFRFDAAS
jgi:arylsulfatase A-like enzyme